MLDLIDLGPRQPLNKVYSQRQKAIAFVQDFHAAKRTSWFLWSLSLSFSHLLSLLYLQTLSLSLSHHPFYHSLSHYTHTHTHTISISLSFSQTLSLSLSTLIFILLPLSFSFNFFSFCLSLSFYLLTELKSNSVFQLVCPWRILWKATIFLSIST